MSRKQDTIRAEIATMRAQGMAYPDIVSKVEADHGCECWFTRKDGVLTVWTEENNRRDDVWTDAA